MIEITRGDILTANAEALVNTVNCVGVMGRGIALQFRKAFPENFKVYESACEREEVRPGRILIFETGLLTGPRYVINFPTKRQDLGGCVRHRAAEAGSEIVIDCRRRPRGIRWCGYSVAALDVPAPPRSPRKRLTGETGSENYCRLAKVQMPGLRTDRHQPSQHKIVPLLPLRSPNPQPRLPTRRFSLLFRYGFCFWAALPPSLPAWVSPVCVHPTRRGWHSAPCRGRTSPRDPRLPDACLPPVPPSRVAPTCPRWRAIPTRPRHAIETATPVGDQTARRCHKAPPQHACTCPPSPGNCTKAGSPPVKETAPASAGRFAP